MEVVDENPDMIAQVGNIIVRYRNVEIHEDNDGDSEEDEEDSDIMHLHKEIGVRIYVVNQKVIEEDIKKMVKY